MNIFYKYFVYKMLDLIESYSQYKFKTKNDDFQYLGWYVLFAIVYTVLLKTYPYIGLIFTCIGLFVISYRMYLKYILQTEYNPTRVYVLTDYIKGFAVFLIFFLFFMKILTNIGSDSLLRLLLMINIAMMSIICIDNPIRRRFYSHNYNNIWLALGLILVSLCTPYITLRNQSYAFTPSWIPVSMFFVGQTILLSYLYYTHPKFDPSRRYAQQVAVWVPLFFFFFNNSMWIESRSLLLLFIITQLIRRDSLIIDNK